METSSALGAYHVTIIEGVVYKKSMIFKCLRISKRVFDISSWNLFDINSKSWIIGALVILETRLKFLIWAVGFWTFFEVSVLAQVFSLRHLCSMYILSRVVRDFLMIWSSEPIINTMQIFVKSALWSGPYKVLISVALIRKT